MSTKKKEGEKNWGGRVEQEQIMSKEEHRTRKALTKPTHSLNHE
jgi:hypothetical protein